MSNLPVNQFELHAREAKCHKLAKWMYEEFLKAAAGLSSAEWEDAAYKAGCANPPSPESQARVLQILKEQCAL
jgi:hypothetical protein